MTKRPTRSTAQSIVSPQADPDVRSAFGVDDAAAAVRIASSVAKAGKKAYDYFKPEVPITVTLLDSSSTLNERRIDFSIKSVSQHTVYIEDIGVANVDKIALLKYSPAKIGDFGATSWVDPELPIKLDHNTDVRLRIRFELPRSAKLQDRPTGRLKIGYCWISESKPNRVLEVDFAIRWPGSFVMR